MTSHELLVHFVNYGTTFLTLLVAACVLLFGWYLRYASDVPFVALYHARLWGCIALAIPGFALFPLMVGILGLLYAFGIVIPEWLDGWVTFLAYLSMAVSVFMSFVWFPRAWTPRWFQRALQAGVPKNSMKEMKIFRKLSLASQERLAAEGNWDARRAAALKWHEDSEKVANYPRFMIENETFKINGKRPNIPCEEDIFR